jgi:hypothetical protein
MSAESMGKTYRNINASTTSTLTRENEIGFHHVCWQMGIPATLSKGKAQQVLVSVEDYFRRKYPVPKTRTVRLTHQSHASEARCQHQSESRRLP